MSAKRFLRVGQVLSFGRLCMSRGVSLRFIAQPYLDITVGKHWKPAVINQMTRMMNIEILAQTFANDGLMKRGS